MKAGSQKANKQETIDAKTSTNSWTKGSVTSRLETYTCKLDFLWVIVFFLLFFGQVYTSMFFPFSNIGAHLTAMIETQKVVYVLAQPRVLKQEQGQCFF